MAAAAIPARVSVDKYLHSTFEPDVEYVDGHLEERNAGELEHGGVQRELLFHICQLGPAMRSRVFPGTRVQVAPTRFRVPDICVLPEGFQDTRIIRQAPLLCLEVLSPEDRLSRVLRRARDFFTLGVPEIWIFDPEEAKAYRLLPGAMLQEVTDTLTSLNGEITLDLQAVFRSSRS